MLQELYHRNMFKRKMGLSIGEESHEQFGIVIVPENGAPCGDMIQPYRGGSSDQGTEALLTEVLHVSLTSSFYLPSVNCSLLERDRV